MMKKYRMYRVAEILHNHMTSKDFAKIEVTGMPFDAASGQPTALDFLTGDSKLLGYKLLTMDDLYADPEFKDDISKTVILELDQQGWSGARKPDGLLMPVIGFQKSGDISHYALSKIYEAFYETPYTATDSFIDSVGYRTVWGNLYAVMKNRKATDKIFLEIEGTEYKRARRYLSSVVIGDYAWDMLVEETSWLLQGGHMSHEFIIKPPAQSMSRKFVELDENIDTDIVMRFATSSKMGTRLTVNDYLNASPLSKKMFLGIFDNPVVQQIYENKSPVVSNINFESGMLAPKLSSVPKMFDIQMCGPLRNN